MTDDVFVTYTDLISTVGTFLYGRRLYETMAPWETEPALAGQSPLTADFATAWQPPRRSCTDNPQLHTNGQHPDRAQLHPRRHRSTESRGGRGSHRGRRQPGIQALHAGLVDECILFVWPVTVGGGKPALPTDAELTLHLLDEQRFSNGTLLLRYQPQRRG